MIWAIAKVGPGPWNYIPAEAPCWKAEINVSFRLFSLTFGWQRKIREDTNAR